MDYLNIMDNEGSCRDISDTNLMKISDKMGKNNNDFQPKKLNLEMFRSVREKLTKMNKEIQSLKQKVQDSECLQSNL